MSAERSLIETVIVHLKKNDKSVFDIALGEKNSWNTGAFCKLNKKKRKYLCVISLSLFRCNQLSLTYVLFFLDSAQCAAKTKDNARPAIVRGP